MAAAMSGAAARRAFLCRSVSPPSAITSILRSLPSSSPSSSSCSSSAASITSTFARLSRRKLPTAISRLPVELGCAQSLMPLHSVTASALLNSMLSVKPGGWSWLSEGFTLPL